MIVYVTSESPAVLGLTAARLLDVSTRPAYQEASANAVGERDTRSYPLQTAFGTQ